MKAVRNDLAEWIGSMTVALIGSLNAAIKAGDATSVAANLEYLRERVDDFDLSHRPHADPPDAARHRTPITGQPA